MNKTAAGFFILGFLFGSGPCLASCGPLLVSYAAARKNSLGGSFLFYSLFTLGRAVVYIALITALFFFGRPALEAGLQGGFAGQIAVIGGLFLAMIGALLSIGKGSAFKPCSKLYDFFIEKDKKNALVFGIITGLMPCVPILAVFSYLGLASSSWLVLFFHALSFTAGTFLSPLGLLALSAATLPHCLLKNSVLGRRALSLICGAIIIFLGVSLILKGV